MGRAVLVARLAGRDLRRRPAQGVLLLLVMMAATTALTLGLALHGVTAQPYQGTRAATRGPDVLATAFPLRTGPPADLSARGDVTRLARAPGVVRRSGPFPVASPCCARTAMPTRCSPKAAPSPPPRWISRN
jgi:hypothetical protein